MHVHGPPEGTHGARVSALAKAKGEVSGAEHGRQVSALARSRAEADQTDTQQPEPVPEDGKGERVNTFA